MPSVYGGIYVQQYMDTLLFSHHVCLIQVTTAPGFHLFPFRTEKLSPVTPMVLRNSGRVGSRRFKEAPLIHFESRGFCHLVLCEKSAIFATDNYFIKRLKQI